MKLNKWQKTGMLVLISFLCLALLVGCSSKKSELSSDFDQALVEETGAKVIELVNAKDYQAIRDMGIEEIKKALTDEAMGKVQKKIDNYGEFQKIRKTEVYGFQDGGQEYAVYVAKALYGKRQLTYSIAFDKDMKLAGFYVK